MYTECDYLLHGLIFAFLLGSTPMAISSRRCLSQNSSKELPSEIQIAFTSQVLLSHSAALTCHSFHFSIFSALFLDVSLWNGLWPSLSNAFHILPNSMRISSLPALAPGFPELCCLAASRRSLTAFQCSFWYRRKGLRPGFPGLVGGGPRSS